MKFISDANAIADKTFNDVKKLLIYSKKNRGSVTKIANRLGNPDPFETEWLKLTPKDKMPQPKIVAFPKPPKAADGSLIYERIPNKVEAETIKTPTGTTSPVAVKRRHPGDDVNGVGADNGNCNCNGNEIWNKTFYVLKIIIFKFSRCQSHSASKTTE